MAVEAHYGATPAWFCEFDAAPSRILAHHWPAVPNYGDVWHTDWSAVEPVDILTAGYPCQPFSHAGKRKGADDPRHLWPGIARAIGVLRPRVVVLENVRGHLSLGLADVLGDLSALGYDARWGVVRAADAGAPHGRARIFIAVIDAAHVGHERGWGARDGWTGPADGGDAATDPGGERHGGGEDAGGVGRVDGPDAGTSRERERPRELAGDRSATAWGDYEPAIRRWETVTGRPAPRPTEPGRTGERLSPAFVEWLMGLAEGHVTDPAIGLTRTQQLKALGNGVVPAQARLALGLLGGK